MKILNVLMFLLAAIFAAGQEPASFAGGKLRLTPGADWTQFQHKVFDKDAAGVMYEAPASYVGPVDSVSTVRARTRNGGKNFPPIPGEYPVLIARRCYLWMIGPGGTWRMIRLEAGELVYAGAPSEADIRGKLSADGAYISWVTEHIRPALRLPVCANRLRGGVPVFAQRIDALREDARVRTVVRTETEYRDREAKAPVQAPQPVLVSYPMLTTNPSRRSFAELTIATVSFAPRQPSQSYKCNPPNNCPNPVPPIDCNGKPGGPPPLPVSPPAPGNPPITTPPNKPEHGPSDPAAGGNGTNLGPPSLPPGIGGGIGNANGH